MIEARTLTPKPTHLARGFRLLNQCGTWVFYSTDFSFKASGCCSKVVLFLDYRGLDSSCERRWLSQLQIPLSVVDWTNSLYQGLSKSYLRRLQYLCWHDMSQVLTSGPTSHQY